MQMMKMYTILAPMNMQVFYVALFEVEEENSWLSRYLPLKFHT